MKLLSTTCVLLLSSSGSVVSAGIRGAGLEKEPENLFITGNLVNIIVQLNDDSDSDSAGGPPGLAVAAGKKSKAAAVARGLGLSAKYTYGATVYGFSAQNVPEARLQKIASDPLVKSVEIDGTIHIDPQENEAERRRKLPGGGNGNPGNGGSGGQNTILESIPWGITRVWSSGNVPIPVAGMRACVIDTGIDLTNNDLNVASDCFTAFDRGPDASCRDGHGHGTHVAGTIAAIDNNIDVVGVAPGATVVAVKVLDSRGSGSSSGVIAGIDWAAMENRCDVANLSLGGGVSNAIDDAVIALANAGVKVALAAGNDSQDAINTSPARVNGDNIFTVAASDINNNMAPFSNYGSPVDVAAPGVGVASLKVGGGVVTMSGTSMAAPHVAGLLMCGDLDSSCYVSSVSGPYGNSCPIVKMC